MLEAWALKMHHEERWAHARAGGPTGRLQGHRVAGLQGHKAAGAVEGA